MAKTIGFSFRFRPYNSNPCVFFLDVLDFETFLVHFFLASQRMTLAGPARCSKDLVGTPGGTRFSFFKEFLAQGSQESLRNPRGHWMVLHVLQDSNVLVSCHSIARSISDFAPKSWGDLSLTRQNCIAMNCILGAFSWASAICPISVW